MPCTAETMASSADHLRWILSTRIPPGRVSLDNRYPPPSPETTKHALLVSNSSRCQECCAPASRSSVLRTVDDPDLRRGASRVRPDAGQGDASRRLDHA